MTDTDHFVTYVQGMFGPRRQPGEIPFSSVRWPHTYAYDFVRGVVAAEIGRGDAGRALSGFTQAHGLDEEQRHQILCDLARCYCREHHIEIPEGY